MCAAACCTLLTTATRAQPTCKHCRSCPSCWRRSVRTTHLKMRRTTLVKASWKPMSDVSCSDMDANRSPPRNSSVKISTYTGLRLKGASCAAAPGGPPGLVLLLPAAVLPGTGDGLLLLLPPLGAAGCPLLAACGVPPALAVPAAGGCGLELLLGVAEGFGPPGPGDTAAVSAAAKAGPCCRVLLLTSCLRSLRAGRPRTGWVQ